MHEHGKVLLLCLRSSFSCRQQTPTDTTKSGPQITGRPWIHCSNPGSLQSRMSSCLRRLLQLACFLAAVNFAVGRDGPKDYRQKFKVGREDFVISMPVDQKHLTVARGSRAWRQVANSVPKSKSAQVFLHDLKTDWHFDSFSASPLSTGGRLGRSFGDVCAFESTRPEFA